MYFNEPNQTTLIYITMNLQQQIHFTLFITFSQYHNVFFLLPINKLVYMNVLILFFIPLNNIFRPLSLARAQIVRYFFHCLFLLCFVARRRHIFTHLCKFSGFPHPFSKNFVINIRR